MNREARKVFEECISITSMDGTRMNREELIDQTAPEAITNSENLQNENRRW